MIKKLAILSLICLFFSKFSSAQVTGCYTAGSNSVHTNGPYNGVYANNTGNVYLSPGYCRWTPTSGPACQVCTGTVITTAGANLGKCWVSTTDSTPMPIITGYSGTFTMLLCPLDDNLMGLIFLSAFVGIFLIRKPFFVNSLMLKNILQ